ncbi:hypothetical protein LUZ61_018550 [Rhynchospora tenuis]|uniref:KIB1-4 beta-propeller domain-containing protein n=1 Tax=Rhynchospora tenuis TaxID=198213 RepID=A0AAD6EM33_9POAL|nr:hypothetical protein LUZ61_018550 [Rhynchospora tenuis]
MRKKGSSYSLLSDFRDCHDWAHLDDFRDFLAKMRKKGSSSSLSSEMRKKGSSSSLSSDFRDCRDWAHLPPELVELISQRLKSITDYIRFRAVCYPWRAATASLPNPRHLPPQLPWIMPPLHWAPPSGVFFDDIWEAKNPTFHLPGTERRANNCACYRGWLLFAEYSGNEVFLMNPLTQARIQLPPFAAPLRCLGDDSHVPSDNSLFNMSGCKQFFCGSKMIFSTDLTDPNCLITVLINGTWVICCRVGDPYWTRVDCCLSHVSGYYDVTYYNGRFFFLCTHQESMSIFDSNNTEEKISL